MRIFHVIIFLEIFISLFLNKINQGWAFNEFKITGLQFSETLQQKTLSDSDTQTLSESLITLTPGNLNLSGNSQEIKLEFEGKGNLYSLNYSNFELDSKIEGQFDTEASGVILRPINFSIKHIYNGETFSIARAFRIFEKNYNWLDYYIGIGYESGELLSKNSIKVAFLTGSPEQRFTNKNIIVNLGPKFKTKILKNTYLVGQYYFSHSIHRAGQLGARMQSQSINLGVQYDFFETEYSSDYKYITFKKKHLLEFVGTRANLLISGLLEAEADDFSGIYDISSALNLFSNEVETRYLFPMTKKQYFLFAANLAKKETIIETETIPISGNDLRASANFKLDEIGVKIGQRYYITQQSFFKFYTNYGLKIVHAETKLKNLTGYKGQTQNRNSANNLLYGGLFGSLGFSKEINNNMYIFNEIGLEYYDGSPVGEPVLSIGSNFNIGVGISF